MIERYRQKGLAPHKKIRSLEQIIGFRFKNPLLALRALTHRSVLILWRHETQKPQHNEVLEFLGDSLLNFTISHFLLQYHGCETEGDLSRARALIVGTENLLKLSQKLDIQNIMFLGPSEKQKLQKGTYSVLPANAVEAIIGASYLDQGIQVTQELIWKWFGHQIQDRHFLFGTQEPKSYVQHIFQKYYGQLPVYEVVHESNDGVHSSCTMRIVHGDQVLGEGTGRNKQEASIKAAEDVLKKFDLSVLNSSSEDR